MLAAPSTGPAAAKKSAADLLTDDYLARLLSYSVDAIRKEPAALKSQSEALKQEIHDTALTHYQGFIEAASCFKQISAHVKKLKEELGSLTVCLDSLQDEASSFRTTAQRYKEDRASYQSLLSHHATILDILEIPQLIDTCVRNHSYDEALDLLALVAKLCVVAGAASIVQQLAADAAAARDGLQRQLLSRLSQDITLPECLTSVSYLRRLGTFSEADLRMQFLKHREQWFASVLAEPDDSSVPDYVRSLTDAHRSHMFDIVMQFRAIFYDAEADATDAAAAEEPAAAAAEPVLGSWAHHRAALYVERLDSLLPTVADGSTLGTLVEAAMHCGRSLARVGLDFRGPLAACVARAARGLFHGHIARALAMFCSSLDMHKWTAMPAARVAAVQAASGGGAASAALSDATPLLMQHPPLAVFANAIIVALNAVRSVALASAAGACAADVQAALRDGAAMLVHVPAARELAAPERAVHLAACRCMHETLCPLALTLFEQVFGSAGGALTVADAALPLKAFLAEHGDAPPPPPAASATPPRPSKASAAASSTAAAESPAPPEPA